MSSYRFQAIVNIAEICYRQGIREAVISPGSRSAPLTLAFVRHPHIQTRIINDERVAAFVAMGMAQQSNTPVVLICTSGSASLNYFPAVAEAFFQQIPLLVLTADRPPEWIDQLDGQTIRQQNVYGQHVKKSYQLPVSYADADAVWHIERSVSEAILLAKQFPPAPVHLNCPFREPFYPKEEEVFEFTKVKTIHELPYEQTLSGEVWQTLASELQKAKKVLVVGGQMRKNEALLSSLEKLQLPVLADVISNLGQLENVILHQDAFLGQLQEEDSKTLQPDLLITFGKSLISKQVKLFLRKHKPKQHWHIQEAGEVADTFQSLRHIIRTSPVYFFEYVATKQLIKSDVLYLKHWQTLDKKLAELHTQFFDNQAFTEFEVFKILFENLPKKLKLHLANSMSVRYANFINLSGEAQEVFANRGTSGIDGSTSTTIGHSLCDSDLQLLITGDVSFFYDSNAFWVDKLPPNLRIVLLNNHGGGIFKMIPAKSQPECDAYFVGKQPLNATLTAQQFGMDYVAVSERADFERALPAFFEGGKQAKILEVFTKIETNTLILEQYKKAVSKSMAK